MINQQHKENRDWVKKRMEEKGYNKWSEEASYGARRALIDLVEEIE